MSLTQYLESQEDQDMIRLLNFTRTQEMRRDEVFFFFCFLFFFLVCLRMKERRGLYSSDGGNMNGRPFNEG